MYSRYRVAIETELEINKLLDAEAQAEASSEYDMLHLSQQLEQTSKDESEETPIDDTTEDTPTNDIVDSTATEQLRAISIEGVVTDAASNALQYAGSYLYELGVQYGPSTASKVYKGVIYAMGKLADIALSSVSILVKYIDKRLNSYQSIKTDIKTLRASIDELTKVDTEDTKSDIPSVFTQAKVINVLMIEDSIDITSNLSELNTFIDVIIKHISHCISGDMEALKHLIAYADSDIVKVPSSVMSKQDTDTKLTTGVIEGFSPNSDMVISKYYPKTLPGNVKFIYFQPATDVNDIDSMREAYSNANMFLGHDVSGFKSIESIPYMNVDDLVKLLDAVEHLCDISISHQSIYEQILHKKQIMNIGFRSYFHRLINKQHKVSISHSLLDYMQLKQIFIDKVYIAAMIDINEYSVKVITNTLVYIRANVKALG